MTKKSCPFGEKGDFLSAQTLCVSVSSDSKKTPLLPWTNRTHTDRFSSPRSLQKDPRDGPQGVDQTSQDAALCSYRQRRVRCLVKLNHLF